MNKKPGRPKSISSEEMLNKMYEVAERFPGKITYSLLEKETGITRRKWQYDKQCVNAFERINAEHLNLDIVSKADAVQKNLGRALTLAGNNQEKINAVVNSFTDTMNSVIKIAMQGQKYKEDCTALEKEVEDLKEQLAVSRENENKYKHLLARLTAESKYSDLRKINGLNKDMLKIEDNLGFAGAIGSRLDDAINQLFE